MRRFPVTAARNTWCPFLTGVLLGLVLLAFVGVAVAQAPDDARFDALLRAHVRDGNVDYAAFARSADFRSYVADLAKPATLQGRDATLAYYINAYNALAIAGILDGLSPSTVLGRVRYFSLRQWALNGESITLYDLEHEVLRPLGEPRIHFAIVCASKSCPSLRAEAYVASRLSQQLDAQARGFVNDRARNRFDPASRSAQLSAIFKWFDGDFAAAAAGSTQRYISRYAADPEVAGLLAAEAFAVRFIDYDWTLNGSAP